MSKAAFSKTSYFVKECLNVKSGYQKRVCFYGGRIVFLRASTFDIGFNTIFLNMKQK